MKTVTDWALYTNLHFNKEAMWRRVENNIEIQLQGESVKVNQSTPTDPDFSNLQKILPTEFTPDLTSDALMSERLSFYQFDNKFYKMKVYRFSIPVLEWSENIIVDTDQPVAKEEIIKVLREANKAIRKEISPTSVINFIFKGPSKRETLEDFALRIEKNGIAKDKNQ